MFNFEVWQSKRKTGSSRSQSNEITSDDIVDKTASVSLALLSPPQNSDSLRSHKKYLTSQSSGRVENSSGSLLEHSSIDNNPSIIDSLVVESSAASSRAVLQRDYDDPSIPALIPIYDDNQDGVVSTIICS